MIAVTILLMTLACINFDFRKIKENPVEWISSSVIGMLTGFVLSFLIIYLVMPPLIPIIVLLLVSLMILLNTLISFIADFNDINKIGLAVSISLVFTILIYAAIVPAVFARDLHEIPGISMVEGKPDMLSIEHIRVVPYETALWKADKKVGEFGYKVEVCEPDIQYRNDELTWLVPFDYNNWYKAWKWRNEGTNAYIVVSAEDPLKEPVRIQNLNLRYIQSGIFSHNLYRHIYWSYPTYYQKQSVFQLDQDNNPIFVTMLTRPTIGGVTGEKPVAVIVTDPQTGIKSYYRADHVPAYVQRYMDEELTEKYLGWWGSYVHGWWNSWWSQRDVKKPTGGVSATTSTSGEIAIAEGGPDVYMVRGNDDRLYWFSAITTPGKDTSMVGYILIDVTKCPFDAKFYTAEGFFNDIGAAQNVQQDPDVSKVMGYRVAQPIMYLINNTEVWIVPVLSSQNELKEVGVVVARGGKTFVAEELENALAEYTRTVSDTLPVTEERTKDQIITEIQRLLEEIESKLEEL